MAEVTERSVLLVELDGNDNQIETTFRRINPNVADATLRTGILNLKALTNNTFVAMYVIDKRDITEEETVNA